MSDIVNDGILQRLTQMAQRMRINALEMALGAGKIGAHLGSAMSCIEIFAVLYGEVMKIDSENPEWMERDRMIASKAHCVLAHYTALAERGYLSKDDLLTFERNGTFLAGHPVMDLKHGIEYSGGSLGMALSVGVGMAIDAKQKERNNKVYILLGDGECDEGSNWEAFMSAAHFKLDNLVAIIDKNKLQYDGPTDAIMNLGDLENKLIHFGWKVSSVDGHNIGELLSAFEDFEVDKPHVIIANTVKGKGISFMEGAPEWHHAQLKQEQYDIAVAEVLGGITC